ncbi:MAG: hypothetical protein Fur0041_13720 [Bacteroidia bacterium]
MNILIYAFIVFVSVLGSGAAVTFFKIPEKPMRLLLAYSGAFLFGISLLHLVPELYEQNGEHIGIWILAGFLLQLLLEYISEGIEHGHAHIDTKHHHQHNGAVPWGVVTGLSLHSFLEGMPLGMESGEAPIFTPFLTGIVLHNIPIAVAFMGLLIHLKVSRSKAFIHLIVFALMTPLGMFVSRMIGNHLTGDLVQYYSAITGVVVGIFLHISTTILFESTENHRFNAIRFVTILFGVATAWLITLQH